MRIHVRRVGDGTPPIVFVHGLGMSGSTWNRCVELLSPSHETVAIDLIGHGLSPVPDDPADYNRDAALCDLDDVLGSPALHMEARLRFADARCRERPAHLDRSPRGQLDLALRVAVHRESFERRVDVDRRAEERLVRGGASARDVVRFAAWVRARVHARFGVALAPEPDTLGSRPGELDALVGPVVTQGAPADRPS